MRGARSTDGERGRFEVAMEAMLALALSSATVSDSESKSVVGLRSVRRKRARGRSGMAMEARDPMAGPAVEATKRRLTPTAMSSCVKARRYPRSGMS